MSESSKRAIRPTIPSEDPAVTGTYHQLDGTSPIQCYDRRHYGGRVLDGCTYVQPGNQSVPPALPIKGQAWLPVQGRRIPPIHPYASLVAPTHSTATQKTCLRVWPGIKACWITPMLPCIWCGFGLASRFQSADYGIRNWDRIFYLFTIDTISIVVSP